MRELNSECLDVEGRKYAYDFDYIHRHYMIKSLLPHFVGESALELGCYKGEFSKLILQHYPKLTIVEGASDLIKETERNIGDQPDREISFKLSHFEEVELTNKYDAVFLVHTLEHLDDPVALLKRIRGWLAPAGKLFLVVPNANAASRQIAVGMGLISHNQAVTPGERAHGHRRTYSLDTLLSEVRQAGLNAISNGGILFKGLANFQLDRAYKEGIIDNSYFDGCYELGQRYPDLCASVFAVCQAEGEE
jgi:2-polyprenyl-3-methyl-5-hydroxy-6-metoxy-1,4-benzoquinol methylase